MTNNELLKIFKENDIKLSENAKKLFCLYLQRKLIMLVDICKSNDVKEVNVKNFDKIVRL